MARQRKMVRTTTTVNVTNPKKMVEAVRWYPYFLRAVELRPYFNKIVQEYSRKPAKLLYLVSIKSYSAGFNYPFIMEYPDLFIKFIDMLEKGEKFSWPPKGRPPLSRIEIENIWVILENMMSSEEVGGKNMSLTRACEELSKGKIEGIHRSPDQLRNIYNKVDNIYEFILSDGTCLKDEELTYPRKK